MVAPVIEEGGFFELTSECPEDDLFNKAQLLKTAVHTGEIDVYIDGLDLTEELTSVILEAFGAHARQHQRWNEVTFCDCIQNQHLQHLISQSAALQLFRKVTVLGTEMEGELSVSLASAVASMLQNPLDLEKLTLHGLAIPEESSEVLGQGLSTADKADCETLQFGPEELVMDGMTFLEESPNDASIKFADGLAKNRSLQSLRLCCNDLPDSRLSKIVDSLVGHPSLKILSLWHNEAGDDTMQSLQRLLSSSSCHLSELQVSDEDDSRTVNVETLIEGLKKNCSLHTLDLSENDTIGGKSLGKLLNTLWRCPKLTNLHLSETTVDISTLGSMARHGQPSRLRVLDLDDSLEFADTQSDELVHLLETHAELGDLGSQLMDTLTHPDFAPRIRKQVDLNRCGRILLKSDTAPLSLWSLVFEKVNTDEHLRGDNARMASVIYDFLHGPSFAGRG